MAQPLALRAVSVGTAAGLVALVTLAAITMRFQLAALSPPEDVAIVTVPEIRDPPPPPPREPIVREPRPVIAPSSVAAIPANPIFPPIPFSEPVDDAPPVITQPRWLERPNGGDFARHYPRRAIERNREGRVVLDCTVAATGRLACAVASEEPSGWGFGAAAVEIS